jgi:F-type H+-transporting ATPase subunit b
MFSLATGAALALMPAVATAAVATAAVATAAVATAAEEHAAARTDPLSVDPDLAIWTAVVFLLLLAVLAKFAWGPISQALDQREQRIADYIAAAEQAGEEGRRLLTQYEAKLAGAADEVRRLLEEARRDAEHTRQHILDDAKAGAQAEHDRQMREIRIATDQAIQALAEASANMAVDLAGKIVRAKLSAQDHEGLIREAVEKFAAASPSKN